MQSEITDFRNRCLVLSVHRSVCVGEPLDTSFLESWPADVRSSAEFASLVSASYQMWQESWKLDIGFLLGNRRDGAAYEFDQLIYTLRTAAQHTDNRVAEERSQRWLRLACAGQNPEAAGHWHQCGTLLMKTLNAGMEVLNHTAAMVRRDQTSLAEWQAKVGESPEAAITRVAADLGLRLSLRQRENHARRVASQWKYYVLRPGETATDVLADFAEQALVSRMDPLPCDYLDVLDELRVLGSGDAVPSLHLAHAVAEITGASGEDFLKRLGATWAFIRG
ncbi:MAG: hypothetical protein ACLQI7_20205 [Streptosporangiaceae bacterium]